MHGILILTNEEGIGGEPKLQGALDRRHYIANPKVRIIATELLFSSFKCVVLSIGQKLELPRHYHWPRWTSSHNIGFYLYRQPLC